MEGLMIVYHEVSMGMNYSHYETCRCVEAYNLDGGGSSTLAVRENGKFVIKNVLSERYERPVTNCLLVVTREPEYEAKLTNATDKTLEISVSPTITNGHDFNNLYAYITGGIEGKVIDGKVSFSGLQANSTYNCRFYYKVGDINVDLLHIVFKLQ